MFWHNSNKDNNMPAYPAVSPYTPPINGTSYFAPPPKEPILSPVEEVNRRRLFKKSKGLIILVAIRILALAAVIAFLIRTTVILSQGEEYVSNEAWVYAVLGISIAGLLSVILVGIQTWRNSSWINRFLIAQPIVDIILLVLCIAGFVVMIRSLRLSKDENVIQTVPGPSSSFSKRLTREIYSEYNALEFYKAGICIIFGLMHGVFLVIVDPIAALWAHGKKKTLRELGLKV